MQLVPWIFLGTVAGLLLAPFSSFPQTAGWILTATGIAGAAMFRNRRRAFCFCLMAAAFCSANLRYSLALVPNETVQSLDRLSGKVKIVGTVFDVRQLTAGRTYLELNAQRLFFQDRSLSGERELPLRIYVESGGAVFLPGDVVEFYSRLRPPRLFGTPGEFHWPRYLSSRSIAMTGWVKNGDQIRLLAATRAYPRRALVGRQRAVAAVIDSTQPAVRAQLTRALVLGEGRVIEPEVRNLLARSGISHLFAISGLHLGLIALFGYRLLSYLYCRSSRLLTWQPPQRLVPLLLLPGLFVYLLLTGDAVATRRAFALFALGAVFLFWRYYVNPLRLLLSLALLSLLVNPLLLWQAGWQLSFAGAAGILLWQPWWGHERLRMLPVRRRYPAQLMLATMAATLATTPLVLLNFHLLVPLGWLANFICVPLVSFVALPVGLAGLILFPCSSLVAAKLFTLTGSVLGFLVALVSRLNEIPLWGGEPLFLSRWQYLAVACLIVPMVCLPRLASAWTGGRLVLIGVVTGCCLWWLPALDESPLALTMFSVGQGESMLLQNRAGQAVLIDGGGLYSDRFDVGERLLAPALGEMNVRELEAVVLTHDHPDHRKGLIYILDHFPVKRFLTGHRLEELDKSLQQALLRNHIPCHRVMESGWRRLGFWHSGELLIYNGDKPGYSENNASLVMYLAAGVDQGLLLTGDIEREAVRALLDAGLPGPVSLLKLPHHGSRYSLTDSLTAVLAPRHCLVSVGYRNRYQLPSRQVVEDLEGRRIPLYRTDLMGTLRAELKDNDWNIRHWKRGFFVDIRR